MRNLTLNVAGLPADVKLIYEKRQAQVQITKSDIKKFKKILTIQPGDITNTQKELNFIRWPARKLNFLIYKDGTIFRNLRDHIKDQRQNFRKSLMPIKKWDAKGFYKLYCNIKEQCLQHCLWVLPYCCHSKACSEVLGFVCANEFVNNDSGLPYEFRNHTSSWSTTIYEALNCTKVLPEDAKTMLANCDGCGYTFLRRGCVMFNPNLVENPTKLLPSHPRQGKLSYDEYMQAVCFHYTMQGPAADHRFPFDDENIQDTFISHLNYSGEIQRIVNNDCSLPRDSVKQNYSAGLFEHTIAGLVKRVQPQSRPTGTHPYYPSRSFLSQPRNLRPRVTNAIFDDDADATGFFPEDDFGNSQFLHKLNSLERSIDFRSPQSMWDYAVFGLDLSDAPRSEIHSLVKGINAIAKDFNSSGCSAFNTSQTCAICGGVGHNFSACPALQDSTKVKEAYIRLRVALNHFFNSIQKLRDGNGSALLSTLSAIGMPTLEQISALHQ